MSDLNSNSGNKLPLLCISIDGVLFNADRADRVFYEQVLHNAGLPKPEEAQFRRIHGMSMPSAVVELAGASSPEVNTKLLEYAKAQAYPNDLVEPDDVAIRVIRDLASRYRVIIMTSKEYPGLVFADRIFTGNTEPVPWHAAAFLRGGGRVNAKGLEAMVRGDPHHEDPSDCIVVIDELGDHQAIRRQGFGVVSIASSGQPSQPGTSPTRIENLPETISHLTN